MAKNNWIYNVVFALGQLGMNEREDSGIENPTQWKQMLSSISLNFEISIIISTLQQAITYSTPWCGQFTQLIRRRVRSTFLYLPRLRGSSSPFWSRIVQIRWNKDNNAIFAQKRGGPTHLLGSWSCFLAIFLLADPSSVRVSGTALRPLWWSSL